LILHPIFLELRGTLSIATNPFLFYFKFFPSNLSPKC
jgi:hypothetical protein